MRGNNQAENAFSTAPRGSTVDNTTLKSETPKTIQKQRTYLERVKSELWDFQADELLELTAKDGKLKSEDIAPLRIAEIMVARPCACCCAFFIFFILALAVASSQASKMLEQNTREIFVPEQYATARWEAQLVASEDLLTPEEGAVSQPVPVKTMISYGDAHSNLWRLKSKKEDARLITPENLIEMHKMDMHFWDGSKDADGYYSFCLAESTVNVDCSQYTRVSVVDELMSKRPVPDNNLLWQEEIDDLLRKYHKDPTKYQLFNQDFGESKEFKFPTLMRSIYTVAYPYPDINKTHSSYTSIYDDTEDQMKEFSDFTTDKLDEAEPDWLTAKDYSTNTMEAIWYDMASLNQQNEFILMQSLLMVFVAVIFVWVLIAVHTGSIFISMFGMTQIFMSIPVAQIFYWFILVIPFWSGLSNLTLFVVLGIGADDIFIFYDTWMQAETQMEDPDDLVRRLSYTYRRAGKAMAITTFTTCITFLACCTSTLVTVKAFGIFSALVILFDYILSMTLFPLGLVIAWKFPSIRFCYCCGGEKAALKCCQPSDNQKGFRFWERCFGTCWFKFITKCRWGIVIAHVILFAVCIWSATQISMPEKEEDFVDPNHQIMHYVDTVDEFYTSPDAPKEQRMKLTWGINGLDRSNVGYMDIDTQGKPKYDSAFDVMSPEAQEYVIEVCDLLRNAPKFSDLDQPMVMNGSLECFMEDYKEWRLAESKSFPAVFDQDPVKQRKMFIEDLHEFSMNTMPIAGSDMKFAGVHYRSTEQLGFTYDGTKTLRFVTLRCLSDVSPSNGYQTNQESFKDWKNLFKDINERAPTENAELGIWSSDFMGFPFLDTQAAFMQGAMSGIALALPLAFLAMLIATANWIISVMAIIIITGVVCCVLLFIVSAGWDFGLVESVALVVMIGFTVDYTVHIGHAYLENHHLDTRRKRMRMALTDMGVSIFFGALTTFVSVVPLVILPLIVFKKFGTLIMITVVFGLSWALMFFPSLLLIMGPQFDQGAIPIVHKALTWISNSCGRTCAGRGNEDEGKSTPRDKKTSDVELNPLTPTGQKKTTIAGAPRVN